MKHVLTVTLNPSLDRMIVLKEFHVGKEFDISHETLSAGGKGLNVSRALKNLGTPTYATGLLAGVTGQIIRKLLDAEGIKDNFSKIDGSTRVNLMIYDQKTHKTTRLLGLGPKVSASQIRTFKAKYQSLLKRSSLVVISGRNAHNAPDNFYAQLITLAHEFDIPAIVDTHLKPVEFAVKAKPLLIKPNLKELEDFLGRKLNSTEEMVRAIRYLHKEGAQMVLLSMAREGAILSDGNEMWKATPPDVIVQNDVGSGDTMVAGFVHGYLQRLPLKNILCFAVAAGTTNAMGFLPGSIHRGRVEQILKKVKFHKI